MNNELVVKNARTGEIRSFPTTRAGIYNLAKFAKSEETTIHQTMRYIARDILRYLLPNLCGKLMDLPQVYEATWNWNNYFDGEITNVVWTVDGQQFKDDYFYFGRNWLPRKWRQYIKRCVECGGLYIDQETAPYYVLDKVNSSVIGYGDYCHDCVEDIYDMAQCEECGRWFDRDDLTWINNCDCYVCEDCRNDSYHCCDYCGEWFGGDDYVYIDDTGNIYCCEDCAEMDGNHWSEYHDCWMSDDNHDDDLCEVINGYHDNKGYLEPIVSKPDKRVKQDLFIGRETEIAGRNRYDFDSDYYTDLITLFGDAVVLETDASVELETITRPMSERDFFKHDWERPFNKLIEDGWRSHDTGNCGTHFHYSIGYLGFTDKERRNNAKKVCYFVQQNWDDICKIARRKGNHYCYCWNYDVNKRTDFEELRNDRYYAVNLQNFYGIGTIEIRICKGTLKASTMLASADFFLHIVRNAKRISWKNIDNLSLWLKGIKRKSTIDYIKARHAFEGCF